MAPTAYGGMVISWAWDEVYPIEVRIVGIVNCCGQRLLGYCLWLCGTYLHGVIGNSVRPIGEDQKVYFVVAEDVLEDLQVKVFVALLELLGVGSAAGHLA